MISVKYQTVAAPVERKHSIAEWRGKLIGDWRVLDYSHFNNEHYWKVRCSCGIVTARRASQLRLGRTHSCRTCSAKKRENQKSPFWRGLGGISQQYLNRLSFRNKEVTITLEDLHTKWLSQEGRCAYSGVDLSLARKDTMWNKSTASIDRINSSLGYIPGNIQWVHKRVNTMKNDMEENVFLDWCNLIVNKIGKGGTCGS